MGRRAGGRGEANFKARHSMICAGPRDPWVSETCLENGPSLGVTLSVSTMEITPCLRAIEKSLDLSHRHTAFYYEALLSDICQAATAASLVLQKGPAGPQVTFLSLSQGRLVSLKNSSLRTPRQRSAFLSFSKG